MAIKQSLLVVFLSAVLLCSPRLAQAGCSGGPKGNPAYPNSAPSNSEYKNQCPCAFGSFCDTTFFDSCEALPYGCRGGSYMPNCYSGGSAPSCLTCPANYYCPQYGSRSALIPGPVACPAGKTSPAGSDGSSDCVSPSPPPSPPPPLTYALFPGCTGAINGNSCLALADFYMATQLNAGAWTAGLSAVPKPGSNAGGWAFSTANYCAWSGVGCTVAATGVACVSDVIRGCVLQSLCVATRSWLEAGLTCYSCPRRSLSSWNLAGTIPLSIGNIITLTSLCVAGRSCSKFRQRGSELRPSCLQHAQQQLPFRRYTASAGQLEQAECIVRAPHPKPLAA